MQNKILVHIKTPTQALNSNSDNFYVAKEKLSVSFRIRVYFNQNSSAVKAVWKLHKTEQLISAQYGISALCRSYHQNEKKNRMRS